MGANGGARPGAGRPKGALNKRTVEVANKLAALKCDPIEAIAKLALGDVPCTACKDGQVTLSAWYRLQDMKVPDSVAKRVSEGDNDILGELKPCPVCDASGKEYIPTKMKFDANSELMQYVVPKLKSTEIDLRDERMQRPPGLDDWIDGKGEFADEQPQRPAKPKRPKSLDG